MKFVKVCSLDDLWEGDMASFELDDETEVLLVHLSGGTVKAFQGMCPHQEVRLGEGQLKDEVLTCRAHLWQFNVRTGSGVNPTDCHLAEYQVDVRGEDVYVSIEGVSPHKSHT